MLNVIATLLVIRLALLALLFQVEPPLTADLSSLMAQFLALAGFAGLSAALINAGKALGVIKDGQAPMASLLLNAAGFLVLVLVRVFAPQTDINMADQTLETVAQVLILALGLIGQLGVAKASNLALRGAPVVGFSHSLEIHKAQVKAAEAAPTPPPPSA